MEILKNDFEASLPLLQKAIEECDFVAMDTEMTGLSSPANIPKHTDSLDTRYSKVSVSAANFLVIQLGICTFTWSDEIGGYEARPFNFPCFPSSADEAKAGERFFKCQSTSLEFLIKNGFDFNKWILHGIPYLTRPEEEQYIIRKTEKEAQHATAAFSIIPTDDRNRPFMESTKAKIQDWLQNSTAPTLTVPANNSFFRRLVHQILRTEFNDSLHVTSDAQARTMTVQRLTDEIRQQKEDAKVPKSPTLNLRRVLDMISDAKKPLIGHNCFLDLMQISQQFLWDLPSEMSEWKQKLNLEWKTIIDTKHLAMHPLVGPLLETTGLEIVSECVQKAPFATVGPKIVMAKDFERYLADASLIETPSEVNGENPVEKSTAENDIKYHEAGYDAYITGQAYLRFAGYILKERERLESEEDSRARKRRRVDDSEQGDSPVAVGDGASIETPAAASEAPKEDDEEEDGEISETEGEKNALMEKSKRMILGNPTSDFLENQELQSYYNQLHIMRSDITVMNLAGPDYEPEDRPWNLLLKDIPPRWSISTLFHLFAPFKPFRFTWVDDNSAWVLFNRTGPVDLDAVQTEEPVEAKTLPLGRLGAEYVNPLCVGDDEKAVRGREAGIVPEAANIEVTSWKAWYEERENLERQAREFARNRPLPTEISSRFSKRTTHALPSNPSTPQDSPKPPQTRVMAGSAASTSLNTPVSTGDVTTVDSPAAPVAAAGSKRKHEDDETAPNSRT